MDAPAADRNEGIAILPRRRLAARVAGTFAALGKGFETTAVEALELGWDGIAGDAHSHAPRPSGPREPWYPRGTPMRNDRQLSILCPEEMDGVRRAMGLDDMRPEWFGANMLLEGVPHLTFLPRGTLLFFERGAVVKIDDTNAPCLKTGRLIASRAGLKPAEEAAQRFVGVADRLRGTLGYVQKPGTVRAGDSVEVRIMEQWLWPLPPRG